MCVVYLHSLLTCARRHVTDMTCLIQWKLCFDQTSQIFLQWLKLSSDDVKEQIFKLAKKGLTPSQIGELFQSYHSSNLHLISERVPFSCVFRIGTIRFATTIRFGFLAD